MYDYQGRSYLHIPQDVGVNLRSSVPPEKCYLPKKQIHVWSGHTKVRQLSVAIIQPKEKPVQSFSCWYRAGRQSRSIRSKVTVTRALVPVLKAIQVCGAVSIPHTVACPFPYNFLLPSASSWHHTVNNGQMVASLLLCHGSVALVPRLLHARG